MARVTVEDCILRVPNRFDLVLMSSQRAREISAGAPLIVERDNDKNPVVALREIADRTVSLDHLHNALVQNQQRYASREEAEEDEPEFDVLEGELEASARMTVESDTTKSAGPETSDLQQAESEVSLDALAEYEATANTESIAEDDDA